MGEMKRYKILKAFIITLLFIISTQSTLSAYIDYDDLWYANQGSDDDGIVWGGYYLDVGIDSLTSNADVACFDWDGDGRIGHCFFEYGVSPTACDYWSVLADDGLYHRLSELYGGHCSLGDDGCNHQIGTGSSGDSWNLEVGAIYFEDCNEPVPPYTFVDYRDYWVVYGHQYNCNHPPELPSQPDYEGRYDSRWTTINEDAEGVCLSSQACDENHDERISYVPPATPPSPCRTKNGYACTEDDQCISDNCCDGVCSSSCDPDIDLNPTALTFNIGY